MIAGIMVLAAAGCVIGDDFGGTFTVDQRIDGATSAVDPESRGTKLCVTTAGVVYVAWLDDRDGALAVWLQRSRTAGSGGWFDRPLKASDAGSPTDLHFACDARGAWLVWQDGDQIWFDALLEDADAAGADVTLGTGRAPAVVTAGADVSVVWAADAGVTRVSSPDGQTWGAPEIVVEGAVDLDVAAYADGAAIAWRDEDGGVHATTLEGTTPLDLGVDHLRVCAAGARVGVVWQTASGQVLASTSSDGGATWGAPERMDADAAPSVLPTCAVDGEDVVVAWTESAAVARTLGDDGPAPLATAGTGSALTLAAAEGAVVAGWTDTRNADPDALYDGADLFYTYRTDDWAGEDFRLDSMYDAGSWKVDASYAVSDGAVFAAWIDGRNGTGDVYFTTFPLGEASDPPSLSAIIRSQR